MMQDRSKYAVQVFRSDEDCEALRATWEGFQPHPNAGLDFYLMIHSCRPQIVRPHVVLLTEAGTPKAMAVGRLENGHINFDIGYRTLARLRARLLIVIYGGLLGDVRPEHIDLIVAELIGALHRGEADALMIANLRRDSEVYQAIYSRLPRFMKDSLVGANKHWVMAMPSNMDEFYSRLSAKARHELRRYPRALEKAFPGQVEVKFLNSPEDVPLIAQEAEKIASKTYHRGLGAGFIDNEENRRRLMLSAKLGTLRTNFLYINGEPRAFWIASRDGSTLYLLYTGYDQSFEKYEPGTITFVRMIENLCGQGIGRVDFGLGDAFYKRRFCDESWDETTLFVYSPSLRGVGLKLFRTVGVVGSRLGGRIMKAFRLTDRIKKKWRRALVSRSRGPGSSAAESRSTHKGES